MKEFPIQDGPSVPWSYMAPHAAMAEHNHGQTLERLAERGGLGCAEAEMLVTGQVYDSCADLEALKQRWLARAERVNNQGLMDAIIESMQDEFVGVWKFKTIDEGPHRRRWCASVNVGGRLIDTEDFPTVTEACQRAAEIVEQLR